MSWTRAGGRGWRTAAVVASLAVFLSGCAQSVPGFGSYSNGLSEVPDATIEIKGEPERGKGTVDSIAGNAIFDIQRFWTQQMRTVFNKSYDPVKEFWAINPD